MRQSLSKVSRGTRGLIFGLSLPLFSYIVTREAKASARLGVWGFAAVLCNKYQNFKSRPILDSTNSNDTDEQLYKLSLTPDIYLLSYL